jgi:NAD(P)-dependent dehydrogenase (short-subunit alcohol dehydrogenase family)
MKNQKVVVVTGASRGLGKALSNELSANGWIVVSLARSFKETLSKKPKPGTINSVKLDVSSEVEVNAFFKNFSKFNLKIDALINCAGIGVFKPLGKLSLADWQKTLDTNLTGPFLMCRGSLPYFSKQGGRIINIGSTADHMAFSDCAAYGASKFGLRGLNAVMNEELKARSIFSTLISLGATWTEIWKDRKGFSEKDMLKVNEVAKIIFRIVDEPPTHRIDEMKIFPPKGIL